MTEMTVANVLLGRRMSFGCFPTIARHYERIWYVSSTVSIHVLVSTYCNLQGLGTVFSM